MPGSQPESQPATSDRHWVVADFMLPGTGRGHREGEDGNGGPGALAAVQTSLAMRLTATFLMVAREAARELRGTSIAPTSVRVTGVAPAGALNPALQMMRQGSSLPS